jgi:ribonuclease HI
VLLAPDGSTISEGSEYLGEATNNIAELSAIGRALERTPPGEPVIIYTDSQYAIGVLAKNWKAKANRELIDSIRALLRGRAVSFEYVRGHAGIPMNERADELARAAISSRKSQWTPSA